MTSISNSSSRLSFFSSPGGCTPLSVWADAKLPPARKTAIAKPTKAQCSRPHRRSSRGSRRGRVLTAGTISMSECPRSHCDGVLPDLKMTLGPMQRERGGAGQEKLSRVLSPSSRPSRDYLSELASLPRI